MKKFTNKTIVCVLALIIALSSCFLPVNAADSPAVSPEPAMPVTNPDEYLTVLPISANPDNIPEGEFTTTTGIFYVSGKTLDAPLDLSVWGNIEFDIYIADYELHKKQTNPESIWGPYLDMKGKTNTDKVRYVFNDQVKNAGWNHIVIPIESPWEIKTQDFKDIIWYEIGANSYPTYGYKVINVCATLSEKPLNPAILPEPTMPVADADKGIDVLPIAANPLNLPEGEVVTTSGINFVNGTMLSEPIDISGMDFLEFDIYVNDLCDLSKLPSDPWGAYLDVRGKTNNGKSRFIFQSQIRNLGWNHIKVPINNAFEVNGQDYKDIIWYEIGANSYPKYKFKVLNLCATKDKNFSEYKPEMPENVGVIDEEGKVFAPSPGVISYVKNFDPEYDFSANDAKYIQFQVYNDYIFEDENGLPPDTLRIRLWEDSVNEISVPFGSEIFESGWSIVRVPISSFENQGLDISSIQKVDIYSNGNHTSPGNVRIVNVCLTNPPDLDAAFPEDSEKPEMPDSDTWFYFVDTNSVMSDYGTWMQGEVLDTKHRTEGAASIRKIFRRQTLGDNSMRYVGNAAADLSEATKLKLDLFVSDAEILKNKAKLELRLYTDFRGRNDYYYWAVDSANLKSGWNSLEIDLTKGYKTNGSADISDIYCFGLACSEASFGKYEEVMIKVDNVRANIPTPDDFGFEDDFDFGFDDEFDFGFDDSPYTGDRTPLAFYAFASLICVAFVFVSCKKLKKNN